MAVTVGGGCLWQWVVVIGLVVPVEVDVGLASNEIERETIDWKRITKNNK